MGKIIRFILTDILRNRILLIYTLVLAAFSWSAVLLESDSSKGILTMMNIVLLIVPLVAIMFSTIYLYNSAEFIEMLLSQPIKRRRIWLSLYIGLFVSLTLSYLIAVGIPLITFVPFHIGYTLLFGGILLTAIFISLASLSSILSRDKARGVGISIMIWLYFSVLFDGFVLFLLFQFADYPIEKIMVGISATSPIDLVRILVLLQLDSAALLGYTGAVFKAFFGSGPGIIAAFTALVIWVIIPLMVSVRKFQRKDL